MSKIIVKAKIEPHNEFVFMKEKMLLREEDIIRLESAKEILEQDFMNPPTQKQLSKRVMLNEFKLRTGFKQYFGSTIYDYITRLRMELARNLIVQGRMNMYEIGMEVGFKHQASFTNAFKKYYGILPTEVKDRQYSQGYSARKTSE